MNYRHIFFDLDHTLWDFETNSRTTLAGLFPEVTGLPVSESSQFIERYLFHNNQLWDLYAKRKISKEYLRISRFSIALKEFGIEDDEVAENFASRYLAECPVKTELMPNARETLEYLHEKYILHIISNGFADTQDIKLKGCGLSKYFSRVITSERAGISKPHKEIFEFALKDAGAAACESLMIGDHFDVDILGAKAAGLDQVYYNPSGKEVNTLPTWQIGCLSELRQIL